MEAVAGEAPPRASEDVLTTLGAELGAEAGHTTIINGNDRLRFVSHPRNVG